ncbi:Uncharacterised protein [uncultured archaeon]|nr:Uncharacterised protein [uncultured archaeon]
MKNLEQGEQITKGAGKGAIDVVGKDVESAITRLKGLGANDEMINKILAKGAEISQTIFIAKNSRIIAWLQDGPIGWGWKHIVNQGHDIHIQTALKLPNKEAAVKSVIKDTIENYDSVEYIAGDSYNFYKNYTIDGKIKRILVVVSDRPNVEGRIITAYPD